MGGVGGCTWRRWTDGEIAQITRLIDEDMTASKIAAALGKTRNSVIGIVHRQKLKLHRNSGGGGGHSRKKKEGDVKQSRIPGVLAEPTKPAGPKPLAEPPPDIHPARMRRVPLADLNHNECKWPVDYDPSAVGHHLFCGKATEIERSYCDHHGARAAPPLRGGVGGQ